MWFSVSSVHADICWNVRCAIWSLNFSPQRSPGVILSLHLFLLNSPQVWHLLVDFLVSLSDAKETLSLPGCGMENSCEVLAVLSAWIHSTAAFFQGLPSSKDSTLNGSTSLLCSWMPLMFGFPIIPSITGPQPTQGQWSKVAYQSPANIYHTYLSLHSRLCSTSRTLFQPCSRKPPSYFWLCSESFLFPWQGGIWKSKTNKRLLFPFQNSPLPVGMSEWPKCGARQGEGMVEIITLKIFWK